MISEAILTKTVRQFLGDASIREIKVKKEGLINNTFLCELENGEKYLLQNINTDVFRNPDELMQNIIGVTAYLKKELIRTGGDPGRETLTFLPCTDGRYYYRDQEGRCWRMYIYHDNARTFMNADDPSVMVKIGAAFGRFQSMLSQYPGETLYETIPDFHNTAKRFEALEQSVAQNASGRAGNCQAEIDYALSCKEKAGRLIKMYENGELPLRVTHNDTKSNNVLFDTTTYEAFCVIDLDTVMPGLSLYDFGDAIRSGAANIPEDSPEYDKAGVRVELYEGYVKGYLSTAAKSLTKNEVEQLAFSAFLLTYECGIRFLKDYIDGDIYFKTTYAEHNLVRARNQFAMARDIEAKLDSLQAITLSAYREALQA